MIVAGAADCDGGWANGREKGPQGRGWSEKDRIRSGPEDCRKWFANRRRGGRAYRSEGVGPKGRGRRLEAPGSNWQSRARDGTEYGRGGKLLDEGKSGDSRDAVRTLLGLDGSP